MNRPYAIGDQAGWNEDIANGERAVYVCFDPLKADSPVRRVRAFGARMRALIIGCGYLGRRVAMLWRSRGHEVSALTRTDENAHELRSLGIEPFKGDVLQLESLGALPSADVVLYAVGFDRQSGASKRHVYVQGLSNALREIGPRIQRFFYVSSTSVYGQDAGEWVNESSACAPGTESGQICLAAEDIVRDFFPIDSGRATILRFAGLYGPGRLLRRIDAIRAGEPIQANPDGYLNLIHGDDGARVIVELVDRGSRSPVYLVTDNLPIRRREYYARLAELVGGPPPKFEPSATEEKSLNKRCSNACLRDELGDILRFPTIELGLADAITTNESAIRPPFAGQ
jgi:nucleoside-diphosphate-sugar epimerase